MWHWDQGRLEYFQFDTVRRLAKFAVHNDLRAVERAPLSTAIGLPFFPDDTRYRPWRNYQRVFKLCLLVSEHGGEAVATPVAELLATPGAVTCDEYLHFLLQTHTEPTPALSGYDAKAEFRYPLLFALKYVLAKAAIGAGHTTNFDEILGKYRATGLSGSEDDSDFIGAVGMSLDPSKVLHGVPSDLMRQARESLRVISQISYLTSAGSNLVVALEPEDAHNIFADLHGVLGPMNEDREAEIRRRAHLFSGGTVHSFFDYSSTVVSEVVESGFIEGSKLKKTHVTIERNGQLRTAFFKAHAISHCDVCEMDTAKTYHWTERVLDLHHLLPLSSGTRSTSKGTTFEDLVPVCPTCHRAVHRYYDRWMKANHRVDFESGDEARAVYSSLKDEFSGIEYA